MQRLQMGANAPLDSARFELMVEWPAQAGGLDVSAYLLAQNGKVRGDHDMIFYNQRRDTSGGLQLTESGPGHTRFAFDLQMFPQDVDRIVICATVENAGMTMAAFETAGAVVRRNGEAVQGFFPELSQASEVAMQLVEVYRRNGAWKIRAIGQGFNAGLAALADSFGVDVAEDSADPAPQAAIAAAPALSGNEEEGLATIALRQDAPRAMPLPAPDSAGPPKLSERNPHHELRFAPPASPGILSARLAWSSQCGGNQWRARPLELAMGCLYQLNDGRDGVVQDCDFSGAFDRAPFIQVLPGSDEAARSEQRIRINADHSHELGRCALFAYISRGSANWRSSMLEFSISGSEKIDFEMAISGGDGQVVLALAMLEFTPETLTVTRLGRHFQTHRHMASELGWSLRWRNPVAA